MTNSNGGGGGYSKKQTVTAIVIALLAGIVVGLLFADRLYRRGCTLKVTFAPPGLETSCPCIAYDVSFSFGQKPSPMTLGTALHRMAELTANRETAQISVDDAVYTSPFAKVIVRPPAGSQSSITLLHKLLGQAAPTGSIILCLPPEGGVSVRMAK